MAFFPIPWSCLTVSTWVDNDFMIYMGGMRSEDTKGRLLTSLVGDVVTVVNVHLIALIRKMTSSDRAYAPDRG
jgi:hypothetical protein